MDGLALCPRFEKAVTILTKRWTSLIIFQLLSGSQRFSQMQEALPVSGRLLSERLKELEHEGIVIRTVIPETPVRIEYSLSNKGLALAPVIQEIQTWSSEWITKEEVE
ncbi:winged helix-turn-helix transcriptional regulator [Priestia sp. YIM B13446]|jgi:DNA-binding HxlR family transcriptional regulator|uniref:winged helix-turn-helix transcriptional regulator n=1 Tax=Priestia TaxID=2800373 RepID=UPI00048D701A|nr:MULTISPECIES: winged helix-turn-helix transcriptional regulator [Priestia]RCX25872.1 HxlR family transcriptional regulator [Bacillus sp. AG236]KWU54073.1 HxlR family transcriptional regulator [Priestia megaterium]MBX9993966.1 winged helix-turn-helix transcriptional regulator [Priestia aryabhattai]MCM3151689.1 winged helix-turn-helix transcriptional regulator [Priestia megaterium]MCP1451309.1 DNA-binding HxlR family transcriptional regulator [Priestia megaterium]